MESSGKTPNSLSFKERKGYFIPRWGLVAGLGFAALCVLAVGLIVGYMAPCGPRPGPSNVLNPEARKELPYVRLPRSVIPEHYNVVLQPYIEPGNFTFDGKVEILIRVLEPTSNVTVHINNITVKQDTVELYGPGAPGVRSLAEDKEKQFFILHLKGQLMAEEAYHVRMDFVGTLNDQLTGFYRSSYQDPSGKTR